MEKSKHRMSLMRKIYFTRLAGRCLVLAICVWMYSHWPEQFQVLEKGGFFRQFSLLHILWILWLLDMAHQLFPAKNYISLGSQKHFLARFRPADGKMNYAALKEYVAVTTRSAYKVFLLWAVLILAIGRLYHRGLLNEAGLLLISVAFYVCDLICVLIWCPFRLILRTRCCTTCRIFNWDHLMMFTPLIYLKGFFAFSLVVVAAAVWLVWEFCVFTYPERFWENTNQSLQCSRCTDKLCTQYCEARRVQG